MLFKLRITTVSEVTIEVESLSLAKGKRQCYLDDINTNCHHGETTSVELLVPMMIEGHAIIIGDEALKGSETEWAIISST